VSKGVDCVDGLVQAAGVLGEVEATHFFVALFCFLLFLFLRWCVCVCGCELMEVKGFLFQSWGRV
jgi:hypothetical protein